MHARRWVSLRTYKWSELDGMYPVDVQKQQNTTAHSYRHTICMNIHFYDIIHYIQPVGVTGKLELYHDGNYLGIQWYKPNNPSLRHVWSLMPGRIKKQDTRYVYIYIYICQGSYAPID